MQAQPNPTVKPKRRTTMFLEEDDYEFIRKMAYVLNTSHTDVVKRALDAWRETTIKERK
jgi:hypothetical protein